MFKMDGISKCFYKIIFVTDSSTYNPWKKDVDDMLHDLPIVEQISQLISQLRLPYHVS